MEYIVVGIFVIGLIVRGFRWLLRKTNPPQTPLAPPPSQTPFQPQNPFQAQTGRMAPPPMTQAQAIQQQAAQQRAAQQQARTQPRQPSAGGPAVPIETSRQDLVRQEQELFSTEPTSLGVSLSSPAARSSSAPNMLFSGADDLVRAFILSEVLGPPLSRRQAPPAQPPQQAAPQHSPSS